MDVVTLMTLIATGIEEIDDDHGRIVTCLEEMDAAVAENAGAERILEALERIRSLSSRHFQVEESMMATVRYAAAADHKNLHRQHLAHVDDLIASIRASGTAPPHRLSALRLWFFEHLRTMDHELAQLLHQRR